MLKYLLFLSVLLGSLFACSPTTNSAENSEDSAVDTVENLDETPELAETEDDLSQEEFRDIDPQEFQNQYNLTILEPRAVGLDLFNRFTQESEGRQAEALEIEYPQGGTAIVLVTIVGLADDSVRSQRHRIEFQWEESGWEMVNVGAQYQCRQGRGQQNWGAALCS